MSDLEIQRVKTILRAAGFDEHAVAWMARSCPDVETARRYYGDGGTPLVKPEAK
jgi:hypothetical protein